MADQLVEVECEVGEAACDSTVCKRNRAQPRLRMRTAGRVATTQRRATQALEAARRYPFDARARAGTGWLAGRVEVESEPRRVVDPSRAPHRLSYAAQGWEVVLVPYSNK